jgi:phosphoglycolate phosphatase
LYNYFVDLDGTIIDPKSGMIEAFRLALREVGFANFASVDLDWIIGPPAITSFATLLQNREIAVEALSIYRGLYTPDGMLFQFSVYPEMLQAIADMQTDGQLFICTMKPEALAGPILAELGLAVRLFGADLGGSISTKDEILDRAVSELGINPSACLVIGDRGSDMTAAAKTGMQGLGVTWGYGSATELRNAGAQALCHSPSSLSSIAQRLMLP